MYTLPIIINNRREVICELLEKNNNTAAKSFVVEFTQSTFFNLFSIDGNSVLKTFIENTTDIEFKNLLPSCNWDVENKKFIITLNNNDTPTHIASAPPVNNKTAFYDDLDDDFETDTNEINNTTQQSVITGTKEFNNCSKDVRFIFHLLNNTLQLKAKCASGFSATNLDIENIILELILHNAGKTFSSAFNINIAHPNEFIGMAIDFGSEASQLVVTKFEPQSGIQLEQPSNENLFQNIKSFHLFNKWIEPISAEYYQEEKNTNFYKSVFFLKSQLQGNYSNFNAERYVLNQNENLKMLVDKSSSEYLASNNYKQLPNLKITHKQDNILSSIHFGYEDSGYLIDVKLNQISQKVSNTILKTMIESYLKKDLIQNKTGLRKVRLMVLVPNIYDSDSVRLVHTNVENIFADLALQAEFANRLKAWEVMAISESDSAFIGYMSKQNVQIQTNKDYVIIDAGKGTTDFSIIRTGANNIFNVKPIYRNGFAGAGNLITNAIFETVLHFIQEQNTGKPGIQKFIREKIIQVLATDLAMRNTFFNELERLKFNFSQNMQCKQQWQLAKSGEIDFSKILEAGADLKTVIDILSNIDKVADFYGYVNDVCEMITEKVVLQLEMVKTNLKNFEGAGVVLTGRGFLFGPLAAKMQIKLSERLGISAANMEMLKGNELKDVCIKGVFNRSIRINSELIGYPIQRIKTITNNTPTPKVNNSKEKWWTKLFGSVDGFAAYKHQVIINSTLDYKNLQNSEIIIGSNSYTIDDPDIFENANANAYTTSIDYTSNGYKVRRQTNGIVDQIASLQPIIRIDNPDLQMIVPSLFPNYIDDKYLDSLKVDITSSIPEIIFTPEPMVDKSLLFGDKPTTTSNGNITKRDDLLF
jgi:hypothetical protein